jgi:enoyl-CoA hydratase/carnithine racemase
MDLAPLHVRVDDDGRVAWLRFDHGKANEMGTPALEALEKLVRMLEHPSGPVALVTWSERRSSKGTPIFVAGADVEERVGWSDERVKDHVRWQRRVLTSLRHAPVFHVVVASGVALGWGTEFLLTADWRIATDDASFGLPETGLGILPGAGGTADLWSEIGVAQALRLGMTGERLGAEEARRIGLVNEHVRDVSGGLERATALVEAVKKRSPTANAAFKRAVLRSVGEPEGARLRHEAVAYGHCVQTGEAAVGRAAFAEIRSGKTPPWGPRTLVTEDP